VSGLSQNTTQTNNTASVGTATAPVDVTFGSTGFTQQTGSIGMVANSSGTNGVVASTNVGSTSISTLNQAVNQASNTFAGSNNVSGALNQTASGLNFATGAAVSPSMTLTDGTAVATPISGAAGSTTAPYVVANVTGVAPVLNSAIASTGYGSNSLSSVTQTGSSMTNIATAGGTLDTSGAGGTNSGALTQNLGPLTNYGASGPQNALNAQGVSSNYSGSSSITNASQGLNLVANAVSAGGVNGSITQAGPGSVVGVPQNQLAASSAFGTTTASNSTQTNTIGLNSIASTGALGSTTSPAGFSQTSGTSGVGGAPLVVGYDALGYSSPSNAVYLNSGNGAGATTSGSNLTQVAGLNVNSVSGVGLTGNSTQVSNGQTSRIGNLVQASAQPLSGTLGAAGVASGNSTLSNIGQASSQSLNTLALGGGAANGILNQATLGAVTQNTTNQVGTTSNAGYATVTGTQVASNTVNVIK
jgi:hypothetical protein